MPYEELAVSALYPKIERGKKLRQRYLSLAFEADPVTGVLHRMGLFNNDGKADWFLGQNTTELWNYFSKIFADEAGEVKS
jgi:hypothetical protein